MTDPLCIVASLFVLAFAFIFHPQYARCPHGWYVEGIPPSGAFVCKPNPVGDDHRDARGVLIDDSAQAPGELRGQLYCTGGQLPIMVDGDAVGCQRGGWRQELPADRAR